jgi:hypothetical protein
MSEAPNGKVTPLEMPTLEAMTGIAPEVEPEKKRGRPRKTGDQAPRTGSSASGKLNKDLDLIKKTFDGLFVAGGSMLGMLEPFDGAVLIHGGPQLSDAIVETARANARFREAMVNFCTASAYTVLVSAFASLALPILAHHGFAPRMFVMMAPEAAVDVHMEMERRSYPLGENGAQH